MTGVEIEYLLGLFFALSTVTFENGRVTANLAQVLIGIVLVICAVIGFSPIR